MGKGASFCARGGWERAAWFAVHILASDTATAGLPLRWLTVDLNLPLDLSDQDLACELTKPLDIAANRAGGHAEPVSQLSARPVPRSLK
jgi:hydrogenase maturation factor